MPSAAVDPPRRRSPRTDARGTRPAGPAPGSRRSRALAEAFGLVVACLALLGLPRTMHAQLRPLDPLEWHAFDAAEPVRLELGLAAFEGQRASLAGVRGRLWELGLVRASWRTGQVLFEASGTALRAFQDEARLEEPAAGVKVSSDALRLDAGDWEVSTAVRLTPAGAPVDVALRFGTRLPTTDNRVGLERDATDFFALAAGRWRVGHISLSAESGLGIHGTRDPDFEQSDVWSYALAIEYRRGGLTSRLELIGQKDGLEHRAPRGTEELRELRLSLSAGRKRWIEVSLVRGLAEFSPAAGLSIAVGTLIPTRHGGERLVKDRTESTDSEQQ